MRGLLFLAIFSMLLFGIWQTCFAVDLLLDWPEIGGEKLTPESDLPSIINYIYKFALLACGVTAFVSILVGAIQYVFSAGNASKASDARDRITQALLGVIILLAAVLILRTINPDLVNLKFSLPKSDNNRACYCFDDYLASSETFKQCYTDAQQCISSCINTCPKGGHCKEDAAKCP